jgi:hypothetical protein
MTLLAERHEVIRVISHLHTLNTGELREAYAVVYIDGKAVDAFLRTHLTEGMGGEIGISQAAPFGGMVDLLPVAAVKIIFFAGYSTVFSCVPLQIWHV